MDRFFKITERGSTWSRECLAGLVTFMSMVYIVCVQPQIMSGAMFNVTTGADAAALVTTTCLIAAIGCILMGIVANYPLGLAPGMGENIFVVLTVFPACAEIIGQNKHTEAWHLALGVVLISGIIFALLSFMNIRKYLVEAISPSLRGGMSAGIGLFITLIGLQHANVIICKNNLYILGSLTESAPLVFLVGLIVTASLYTLNIRGSILYGIVVSAITAWCFGKIVPVYPLGLPADPRSVIAQMDIGGVFYYLYKLFPFLLILVFMEIFDTLGTVVGVGTRAGLIKDNQFPDIEKVFTVDAAATVIGAVGGHSTVTAYVESVTGVETGGRTGLTALVIAICFLLTMFCSPCILMIAEYRPITAAALVFVGALMLQSVTKIDWNDFSESIPSFLLMIGIPFSYNIADGLIIGFLVYPMIKIFSGKGLHISWILYVLMIVLVLYVTFLKSAV
ncbi:MAG: NCS2 family permease [Planctomycetaceae bacterium]|jgi:AGZA family xanthine/uracil permease-like MFS transporter|nr:NCS2 family permease [Planctomycetaceae bacterium]